MKRILLASLITTGFLGNIPVTHAWNGNWLVGASVGYGEADGNINSSINYIGPIPFFSNVDQNTSFTNNGLILGAFAGYQAICNNWLLGLELNADWYDDYDSQDFVLRAFPAPPFGGTGIGYNATASYKNDITLGLTSRVGYAVTNYLIPYLRIGLEGSRDHLDVSYFSPVSNNAAFHGDINTSHTSYRFLGGVGIEVPLCNLTSTQSFMRGASIRAEYNYHSRNHSLDGSVVSLDSVNPGFRDEIYSANYKPHFNSGKISLVWNFG